MKQCPNCKEEIEEGFEICWKCNYSLTEKKIVEFSDVDDGGRQLDCLRCRVPLRYSGNFKFHEGTRLGILGDVFEIFMNRESFDLYICPKCGKVEFFAPLTK
jgi:Zn finger protein HypA/HybF involved in hydrogenase expression